ncbi:unnamed protein product [Rotaria sp. Silwood1]|nr:unnamed protein product [Rotaria sp. Silwood1]CAF1606356.1 unnamed protein product [Rotaria sp. Silwood1]CAF3682527.1 unnamed protein product [Rotaria sp. Silwood1]CAF3725880.1 unnamed protein product [Rotaria sp. Silwood1]CAF4580323.1 unnamed protein product [Rotaria sp. Silwood1]
MTNSYCLFLSIEKYSSRSSKEYNDYVIDSSSLMIQIDLSVQWVNEFYDSNEIYKNFNRMNEFNIRQNLIKNGLN